MSNQHHHKINLILLCILLIIVTVSIANNNAQAGQPIPGIDISAKCIGCPKKAKQKPLQVIQQPTGEFEIKNLVPNFEYSLYVNGSYKPLRSFTPTTTSVKGRVSIELDGVDSTSITATPVPTSSVTSVQTPPVACSYAPPPLNCSYIQGPNYDNATSCGLVLSCPSTPSINVPSSSTTLNTTTSSPTPNTPTVTSTSANGTSTTLKSITTPIK